MEQAFLEDLNRVRRDPQAELNVLFSSLNPLVAREPSVRAAMQFFGVNGTVLLSQWASLVAAPPLAWNDILSQTATNHNVVMRDQDMQEHVLPGEQGLGERIRLAGYNFRKVAENIYAFAEGHLHGHAGFVIDWGEGPGGIQDPPGHRINIMDPAVTEVGIDVLDDTNPATDVGPFLVTQDFGSPRQAGNPFVLGVVWNDNNFSGIYDPGEGISDIDVIITGIDGTSGTFTTKSLAAGGYQVRVPNGTYQVTATGSGLQHTLVVPNVVVAGNNVKADFNRRSGLRPPVAANDSVSVTTIDPISISVLQNDRDPDGSLNPASVVIVEPPTYGTAQVDPATGVITYQVGSARPPSDSFLYTVRDNSGAVSNAARVTVSLSSGVNQPPVAGLITATISEDQVTSIAYQNSVSDWENSLDWASVEIVSGPGQGVATVDAAARSFRYTPNANYSGPDAFAYRIADTLGLYSSVANVAVTVAPVNDPPTAGSDRFVTAQSTSRVINVLANDTDIDNDTGTLSVFIAVQPQGGTLTGQGTALTYSPRPGFTGLDRFVYQAVDASGSSSQLADVRVYVTAAGAPWRNPANPSDVDGDDSVSPLDALLVINHLGVNLTAATLPPTLSGGPTPFVDVIGDNLVAPLDALSVINKLGSSPSSLTATAIAESIDALPFVPTGWQDDVIQERALRRQDAAIRALFAMA
jgi:hypothetical protein